MKDATIKIEIHYAETIKEAFTEAIRLSNMLQCYVSFEFNEITCTAEPEMSLFNAIDQFYRLQKNKTQKETNQDLIKLTNQHLEDGDEFEGYDGGGRYKEVWVKREEFEKNKKS